jgi:hypothetical protein
VERKARKPRDGPGWSRPPTSSCFGSVRPWSPLGLSLSPGPAKKESFASCFPFPPSLSLPVLFLLVCSAPASLFPPLPLFSFLTPDSVGLIIGNTVEVQTNIHTPQHKSGRHNQPTTHAPPVLSQTDRHTDMQPVSSPFPSLPASTPFLPCPSWGPRRQAPTSKKHQHQQQSSKPHSTQSNTHSRSKRTAHSHTKQAPNRQARQGGRPTSPSSSWQWVAVRRGR